MAEIRPQPKQEMFLSTPADIAIYGGGAGGGKTWALLLEQVRNIGNPKFGAVVFRRTYPQITNQGGLWDKAMEMFPLLAAKPRLSDLSWAFPSGARVKFAHMQFDANVLDWQGSEIPLICFDELTHFSEYQFFYMLSRNRSTCGVRPYVRGTCNPDADSWVAKLIEWWIDQDTGYAIPERGGTVRYFSRIDGTIRWGDSEEELKSLYGSDASIKSFTFIPALLSDNPALTRADPGYYANLKSLPLVEQEQLLGGSWKVRPEAGKVFNRDWFEVVEMVPSGGIECRYWDFAATEKKLKGDDPDYTAGVKIVKVGNIYYITDALEVRKSPGDIDSFVSSTVKRDQEAAAEHRRRYFTEWEIEPGSAGKRESYRMVTALDGIDAGGARSSGDKLSRAAGLAAQAKNGNVKLLRAGWNERWLTHMHHQPDYAHDDTMDASAGAYNAILKRMDQQPKGGSVSTLNLG